MFKKLSFLEEIDWVLIASFVPLLGAGLVTMRPLVSEESAYFFDRQLIWIGVGLLVFFVFSSIDWRFLKNSGLLLVLFAVSIVVLGLLLVFGKAVRGSVSWIDLYFFSLEPADPIKLLVILMLSKYFTRRHVEIVRFRHVLISSFYVLLPAFFIFLQPDFGTVAVILAIWLGMVVVSGISKKHLLFVFLVFFLLFLVSWLFVFKPYQKDRILSFINPLEDPQGAGYNALQSIIAVGSGQIWGKGIGYGTQSRMEFLPEYRTDFILAAFAEEWGFIGVLIIFFCFGILIWRILKNAYLGQTNFERFFGVGLAVFLMVHFVLHAGMNLGVLPITGLNMPFMSYGGTHMITIFSGLGILMGMRSYSSSSSSLKDSVDAELF